ncbi:hypothetical protein [Longimicrobium sp.]|jgi:hypothetical protein|uniref:hypothetical protein n=1 Tax=Longimicrobium sp. TaxID=2029185 RepID=UPI002F9514D6
MSLHAALQALRCVLPVLLVPALARAQPAPEYPRWTGDFAVLSANALFGGVSAGLVQAARGGSFRDGFTRGAAGGAGVYAGKRIASARWGGAGLVGRQVASVGSSVVWNAGAGRPSFEQVALPLGPVRFYLRTSGEGPRLQARVDVLAVAATAYAATRPELEWDPANSLSAGVMVFRAPEHRLRVAGHDVGGVTYPGTVVLDTSDEFDTTRSLGTFTHERVHVAQIDQVFLALGRPVQEAVSSRVPALRRVSRWMDVDLGSLGVVGAAALLRAPVLTQPWEMEARFLTGN